MRKPTPERKNDLLSVTGTCPLTNKEASIEENEANLFCSECILTLGHKMKDDGPYKKANKHFKDHVVEAFI